MEKYITFEPHEAEALKQIASLNGCSFSTFVEYPDNPAIQRVEISARADFMSEIYKDGYASANPRVYRLTVSKDSGVPSFVKNKFDSQAFKTAVEAKEWSDKVVSELGVQYAGIMNTIQNV